MSDLWDSENDPTIFDPEQNAERLRVEARAAHEVALGAFWNPLRVAREQYGTGLHRHTQTHPHPLPMVSDEGSALNNPRIKRD